MDRVCCERTPSRHRDRGRGGGTQLHRSACEASALACGLAEPRRKGQQTAAGGGGRASTQKGSKGADGEPTTSCRPGDAPGDSRHRPLSPGEVRDTCPGLARSH